MGGLLCALALTAVSCGDDDNEGDGPGNGGGGGSTSSVSVGSLSSGNAALDNALPSGYRIQAVGDYSVGYDESGRLAFIDGRGGYLQFQDGKLSVKYSDEEGSGEVTIKLNGMNLISEFIMKSEFKEGNDYEKQSGKATFNYNSNLQLSSWTSKDDWEEKEDGETSKGSDVCTVEASYSNGILAKTSWVEKSVEDGESETEREEYTLNYAQDYPNPFYQYTDNVMDAVIDADGTPLSALVYVGLFGRASSKLPTSITNVYDGRTYTDQCGPYTYNQYGALESADGKRYTYTTIGAKKSAAKAPALQQALKPFFMSRHFGKRSK